jgi:hypothetical protein
LRCSGASLCVRAFSRYRQAPRRPSDRCSSRSSPFPARSTASHPCSGSWLWLGGSEVKEASGSPDGVFVPNSALRGRSSSPRTRRSALVALWVARGSRLWHSRAIRSGPARLVGGDRIQFFAAVGISLAVCRNDVFLSPDAHARIRDSTRAPCPAVVSGIWEPRRFLSDRTRFLYGFRSRFAVARLLGAVSPVASGRWLIARARRLRSSLDRLRRWSRWSSGGMWVSRCFLVPLALVLIRLVVQRNDRAGRAPGAWPRRGPSPSSSSSEALGSRAQHVVLAYSPAESGVSTFDEPRRARGWLLPALPTRRWSARRIP